MGKASSARSPGLSLRKKSVACKRNERMQNECVEKTGDRAARNASVCTRSGRENVNGCLRYSLCLKFMQNTYFGILDIARNPREGREMRHGSRVNLQIAQVACRAPLSRENCHSRNFAYVCVQNTTYGQAISRAWVFYSSVKVASMLSLSLPPPFSLSLSFSLLT